MSLVVTGRKEGEKERNVWVRQRRVTFVIGKVRSLLYHVINNTLSSSLPVNVGQVWVEPGAEPGINFGVGCNFFLTYTYELYAFLKKIKQYSLLN